MSDVVQLTCELIVRPSLTPADTGCQALLAERQALETRVLDVRAAIHDAAEADSHASPDGPVAQWFNWPNWGNWNNWSNWGNWGNWGNYIR